MNKIISTIKSPFFFGGIGTLLGLFSTAGEFLGFFVSPGGILASSTALLLGIIGLVVCRRDDEKKIPWTVYAALILGVVALVVSLRSMVWGA